MTGRAGDRARVVNRLGPATRWTKAEAAKASQVEARPTPRKAPPAMVGLFAPLPGRGEVLDRRGRRPHHEKHRLRLVRKGWLMRPATKDRKDGYGQGHADARNFLRPLKREWPDLARFAALADFPFAWRAGYDEGHRIGLMTTIRPEIVEQLRDVA